MSKRICVWVCWVLLASACQKEEFIPKYPEARIVKGDTFEVNEYRLHRLRVSTGDSATQVKAFYDQLLSKPGWRFEGDPEDHMAWVHDNMRQAEGSEGYAPIDLSLPGGSVLVEVGDSVRLIETWTSVPK